MAEEQSQAVEEQSVEQTVTEQNSDEENQSEVTEKNQAEITEENQTEVTAEQSAGATDADESQQQLDQQSEAEQTTEPMQEAIGSTETASAVELEDMTTEQTPSASKDDEDENAIDLLKDVELNVKIELGRTKMYVEDVLRITEGSVVELDKLAGDPVDIYVNEKLVARGEVLVLNENFCVRVNQIVRDVV